MLTKLRKFAAAACLSALAALGLSSAASASVQSNMNNYWTGSLGSASVTGPTAYQGQSAGYYTMGNAAFRSPQNTYQIASVQLPSIRAGCGGIDIFSGGFSFINTDQIVAMMKNIASNAIGYAFSLAMKSLSPQISDVMDELNKMAQATNQWNINSCETAQALVDNVFSQSQSFSAKVCENIGTAKGTYSDGMAARYNCQNKGTSNADNANATPAEKEAIPVNKNLTWEAMKKHALFSSDRDLSEMMMTLTGTFISRCPSSGDGGCQFEVIEGEADNDAMIGSLMDGGTIKTLSCGSDLELCLTPTKGGGTSTINPGMKKRVEDMLVSITNKIRSRTPLTLVERDFLNMVSLPVWKMANVFAAEQGPYASHTMKSYADLIALNLVYTWIQRNIDEVREGSINLHGVTDQQRGDYYASQQRLETAIKQKQQLLAQQATAYQAMVANTQRAEAVLTGRIGQRISDAIAAGPTVQ